MFNLHNFSDQITEDERGIFHVVDLVPPSYPEDGNNIYYYIEDFSYWFRHRNRIIVDKVFEYCKSRVLFDIGGGNGYVSNGLQIAGIRSVLVEPGLDGVRRAQERGIKHIVQASLNDAGFREGIIPNVGLFDVLEHIEDDISFLRKILTVLQKDGLLFLSVPSYRFLWSAEDEYAGHFRRYNLKKLYDLASATGFEVIYATYLFSFLPLPIYLFRTIPTKLSIRHPDSSGELASREHEIRDRWYSGLIQRVLNWEYSRISKGKGIPFGSSCFLVLRKPS